MAPQKLARVVIAFLELKMEMELYETDSLPILIAAPNGLDSGRH